MDSLPPYGGQERPEDEMNCMLWVQMHPKASLGLILDAAFKRARFKYPIKTDNTHHLEGGLAQELEERFKAGQQRVDADRADQAGGAPIETLHAPDEQASEEHERITGETPEQAAAKVKELREKLESPEAVLEQMRRDPANWGKPWRAQDEDSAPPLTEAEINTQQREADATLARLRNGEPAPTRGNYDVPARLKRRDSVDEWSRKQ